MKKYLTIIILSLFASIFAIAQEKKDVPYAEADYGVTVINNSHGYEIAPGWWGWYGGSKFIGDTIKGLAIRSLNNPEDHFGFEYDAVSWQFLDKYYPQTSEKVQEALSKGQMDIVGGTFGGHLPYIVGTESNMRQMVYGVKSIYESVGYDVKTYSYQEFMIYPQLPYALFGNGIENSMYENTLAICGRVFNQFAGKAYWQSNDGAKVKALVHDHNLESTCWDVLNIRSSPFTLTQYFEGLDYSNVNSYNPDESEFQFDAGNFAASYGNQAAIHINQTERNLLTAEKFSTIAYLKGNTDYSPQFQAAWKGLLGSQNHDITYCGSEIYCAETGCSDYEGGKYLQDAGYNLSSHILENSTKYLSSTLNTDFKEKGLSLVVFNSSGRPRNDLVVKQLSFENGKVWDLALKYNQQDIISQLENVERYSDGSIKQADLVFYAENMPSMGYRTYEVHFLDHAREIKYQPCSKIEKNKITNDYFQLELTDEGEVLAIRDLQQDNKLILGVDTDIESKVVYLPFDRTTAYHFRSTLSLMDHYFPKGYQVIENGPLRTVFLTRYESPNAHINMYQTLYKYNDRLDVEIEYHSKNHSGDLMALSPEVQREKLFMDFTLPHNGKVSCNTIADFLSEDRDYYFPNSWIDFRSNVDGDFVIMHEGMHAWHKTMASHVSRNKRERVLACELAITVNEYIPGMLRFNQRSSNDNVVRHRFSIASGAEMSNVKNEVRVEEYYYPLFAREEQKHKGNSKEYSFLELENANLILQALYYDQASAKEPMVRLWNPSESVIETKLSTAEEDATYQEVRLDGVELGNEQPVSKDFTMQPVSLKTLKLCHLQREKESLKIGLKYSTLPYHMNNEVLSFEAPMETYRYNHNIIVFEDKNDVEYIITDPFETYPVKFPEPIIKDNYKYYTLDIDIPESYKGRFVRLLHSWTLDTQHGIITCGLTSDYKNRADEPVTVFVNDQEVMNFSGDISSYLEYGQKNKIVLKVLYEKVPKEVLDKRHYNLEYMVSTLGGHFEKMKSASLRVGKFLTLDDARKQYDVRMENPDFSNNLKAWKTTGNIKVLNGENNQGLNKIVAIGNGSISQKVGIKPGNYYFTMDTKLLQGEFELSVELPDGKIYKKTYLPTQKWKNNRLKFVVPEHVTTALITVKSSSMLYVDDALIYANKVAKEFE